VSRRGGQRSQRSRRHRPDRKTTFVCTDPLRHPPFTVGYATWYTRNAGLPGRVQFRNVGKQRRYTHRDAPREQLDRIGEVRTETFVCRVCGRSVPMSREKWQPFVLRLADIGVTRFDISNEPHLT
jgi:hypothetical protein